MNTKLVTAQSCSLFEIDAELEEAFDQLQEEREIAGNISDQSRERCVQLFAELGTKIDRIAAYLRMQQRKATIAAEEAQRLQQRRRSAEQRVSDVKEMLTYFIRCRGLKRLEGELKPVKIRVTASGRTRRIALTTVNPSPGWPIFRSETSASYSDAVISASASATVEAAVTWKPSCAKMADRVSLRVGSSSTIRRRGSCCIQSSLVHGSLMQS